MINKLRTMISKWVLEDKLNDQEIGKKVRKHYWRELHPREHWVWQDDESEMSGYGYDDASSGVSSQGLSGQE